MTPASARWLILASAILFSTGGAAVKTGAFGVAQVSAFRSGIAAAVLAAYLVVARGGRLRVTPRLVPAGICYAATLTLFVAATKLTTAANAIFLQAVAPLYILVLGPWLLAERWTSRDLVHVGALALGLVLCVLGQQAPSASAPQPALGNLLAGLSGLTWAATLLSLRHLGRSNATEEGSLTAVVAGNTLACLVALPFAWPLPAAPASAWASMAYLGVFQIGLAYLFFTRAIRQVSALEASLLLLIEPVLNPIWTWMVHGESPGGFTVAGGAVIVAATAIRALAESHWHE